MEPISNSGTMMVGRSYTMRPKNGANVHSRADNGYRSRQKDDEAETALHQAAWRGHVSAIKLLLEEDAGPGLNDQTGQTALHQAASNGSEAVVQLHCRRWNCSRSTCRSCSTTCLSYSLSSAISSAGSVTNNA